MTRISLLLPLFLAACLPYRKALRPISFDINLHGIADDAPNWLNELVQRND